MMPKVQTTKIYRRIEYAKSQGYTTVSAQGSSRSSKTYNIMIWLIIRCMQVQGTTVSVVRKTLTAARRSVVRDFKEIMINIGIWNDKNWKKGEFIYYFDNGSWMEFFGADNEQKLRGSKRKVLYVNEGNELTFIEWQQLQMRTTLFSIIDYNPSFSDDHWICSLNAEEKTFHFISTYKDNPFLEKKVVDEIESLQWKNPSLWRVYGLGLQAIIEGLIFENVEYIDEIPRWVKKRGFIGMDLGYAHDSTAISEVWIYGNCIYIDEICYKTHMLTSEIINTLKEHNREAGRNFKIISESADPRMVDEIYNAGLDIHAVHKYPGSIMAGIQKMQEFRLIITKRSTNAIKEFKNYTWRQDKEGKWLNEPVDAFNHCFAGETLIMTQRGDVRIDNIKVGDMIATTSGFYPVGKLFTHRCEKIWCACLEFDNFTIEIKATPNHLFKTSEGWKQLQQLKHGDRLYLHKSLMEKNIAYIQANGIIHEEENVCTLPSGSSIMAKFHKAFMCIIKTVIQRITVSKIWNSLMLMLICLCMHKSIRKKRDIWKPVENEWTMPEPTHRNGMAQPKVENGTRNRQDSLQTMPKKRSLPVSSVVPYIEPSISGNINSAQTNVNQHTGEIIQTKTKKQEHALFVETNLLLTNTTKQSVAHEVVLENLKVLTVERADVYDLHIDYSHEFFANGILVHNCIDGIRYVVLEEVLGGYGQGLDAEDIVGMM